MKNLVQKFLIICILALPFRNFTLAQLSCGTIFCNPIYDDNYWYIGTQYGSKKLSGCDPASIYNCHGFVISYFENLCNQPSWYNQTGTPYICPNTVGAQYDITWQNSGRYVRVTSDSTGNIAYYHIIGGDTHSSVKETLHDGTFKYISKYGCNGPLVEHNLTQSFYHLTQPSKIDTSYPVEFWSYIGPIQGNKNIIGINPVTFSVIEIPNVHYSWSIVNGNSNIHIYSGYIQGTVTLIPVHTGTAVLQLYVSTSIAGSARTQQINLSVSICLDGTYDNAGIYNQVLNTTNHVATGGVFIRVSCQSATSISWQKVSGNVDGYFPDGPTISFNMTQGGSISLIVTAKNGSTILGTRTITFYN